MLWITLLLFCISSGSVFAAKLPPEIEKCYIGDLECLPDKITAVIGKVANGHPGLNLPPIDPLRVNSINISQGNSSPVNIQLDLKNQKIIGMKNIKVTKVRGFSQAPDGEQFEVEANLAQLQLIGDYNIKGQVLVLPILGHGKSNLTMDNLKFNFKFIVRATTRGEKVYVQAEDMRFATDTTRLWMSFENLFNGNKALSENMNLFLNENWRDIYQELRPSIQDAFAQIVQTLCNLVFAKVSYSDIYLE